MGPETGNNLDGKKKAVANAFLPLSFSEKQTKLEVEIKREQTP